MAFGRAILKMLYVDGDEPGIPDDDQADVRHKHIFCAFLIYSKRFPPENVAALYGIGRRTAYEWAEKGLNYDDDAAAELRRLIGRN